MRGPFDDQGQLFSYISPERRVPTQHPLRTIRELVREVFRDLDHDFRILYSTTGRPSIPPEQLLSALLLQVFYGVRSERQLMGDQQPGEGDRAPFRSEFHTFGRESRLVKRSKKKYFLCSTAYT